MHILFFIVRIIKSVINLLIIKNIACFLISITSEKYKQKAMQVLKCAGIMLSFFYSQISMARPLDALILQAVETHPLVLAGEYELKVYESAVDTARWQLFPTPSFGVSAIPLNDSRLSDDYAASVGLSQPLWTGGRLMAGLDKAKSNTSLSAASLEELRHNIARDVIIAYGDWLASTLKKQTLMNSVMLHTALRDQVKRRLKGGVSNQSDLALANERLEINRADLFATKAEEKVALSLLSQLVGTELRTDNLMAARSEPLTLKGSVAELQQQAILINPSLKRVQAELLVTNAELKEIKSYRWPDVHIRAEYQINNLDSNIDPQGFRVYLDIKSNFGAALSLVSRADQSAYKKQAVMADIQAHHRLILDQISADAARLYSYRYRLKAQHASHSTAKNILDSYNRQFIAGHRTWLDVMNATRELIDIELQLIDTTVTQLVVSWRQGLLTQGVSGLSGESL